MKIAVCDDDRLLTGEIDSQLQKIREKTGISFETDIFFDGETLWKAIEQNGSYDVVYLDIEMKNMDGIKFEGRTINVKLKKSRKDVRRNCDNEKKY